MISEEVAMNGLALLGTAAAMLVEDAHPLLIPPPAHSEAAAALAAVLTRLGADLAALGAAMAVLARHADDAI